MNPNATIAALAALLATIPSLLTACRSVQPASLDAGALDDAQTDAQTASAPDARDTDAWPARWGDDPTRKGVIVELGHPVSQLGAGHLSRNHRLRTGKTEYADAAALAEALGMDEPHRFRAEGPGAFIFARRDTDEIPAPEDRADLAFKFVSAQRAAHPSPAVVGDEAPQDHIELQRTWFTYKRPLSGNAPRAVMVLIPGMFGTPEPIVDGVERYLRAKGWSVLRMLAHPSRFTERRRYTVPDDPEKQRLIGALVAREYDTRTAECAYAVDAALDFVRRRRAADLDAPAALLGMSGGAMVLPAVHARAPDRFDAAVLVAGGGNSLEISARSNYRKWIDAIEFDSDPDEPGAQPVAEDAIARMAASYLEHAQLDALATAASLEGTPTLVLHAERDRAVPAHTGEALHAALGEPERWVYPMGHELIFMTLPTQVPKIESWLRERLIDPPRDD